MIWAFGILLVALCLVASRFALGLSRPALTALAAGLVFGLAGYAWQGSPAQPGAPTDAAIEQRDEGEQLVTLRREILPDRLWSRNQAALITADAMTRAGRFEDAVTLYGGMTSDYPQDHEAWLAMGNALIAHANGTTPPAARIAYRRAEMLAPESPGVPFFLGLALIQSGEIADGRAAWVEALQRMEEGSEARTIQAARIERLDMLVEQAQAASRPAQ